MIVTGFNQDEIRVLIEVVVRGGVQNKIIGSSDVTVVEAEKSTISIQQVRSLVQGLYLSPLRLRRIAIIYDAHKLSLPAANALLKSLEEAPQYVRFILATSWASRMPVTILSRCTRLRVNDDSLKNKYSEMAGDDVTHFKKCVEGGVLEHEDVEVISRVISAGLRASGPSHALKMAAMRLVDYYRVKGSGGNDKLAREVLLTYLSYN